ncbi:MAG TPA: DUF4037 domain-containing protein [Anaerolineaceae bacterium]|nr:DUF4037 domain-containing protein [Anaerolineaceae bacterium]
MDTSLVPHLLLARKLADCFASLSQVAAIGLGGSQTGGVPDAASDIDLYVFTRGEAIPLTVRQAVLEQTGGASRADLGLDYWGPGDEWYDRATGIEVDLVYFDADWMQQQINRVLMDHQPSLGYTTCFWQTCRQIQIFHDPHGWLGALQAFARQDYPEALRRNIINLNQPVLRQIIPSYHHQIAKAVQRGDWVSINHRLAALLASYFDIIFAVNRVPHPGEKRLIAHATATCRRLPVDMAADIEVVLAAAAHPDPDFLAHLDRLLDRLDDLVIAETSTNNG